MRGTDATPANTAFFGHLLGMGSLAATEQTMRHRSRSAGGLGIADIGFAWAAWIIDPATNALGILQIKE